MAHTVSPPEAIKQSRPGVFAEKLDDPVDQSRPEADRKSSGSAERKSTGLQFVSTVSKDEPIVTRRELWSYYCKNSKSYSRKRAYKLPPLSVYYNGDNVSIDLKENCSNVLFNL